MEEKIFEKVEIIDAGAEGKAIARIGELVVFVPFVVPGDVVDLKIVKKKKSYLEGKAIKFHHYSEKRQDAFCEHFGTCGGCRWQNMKYEEQLFYKEKQVKDSIQRIAKIENALIRPILPSQESTWYRNKLEFTFSNRRWLTSFDISENGRMDDDEMNVLGFHIPLMFDKVLDINRCYLQADPSNAIRLEVKKYARENRLTFYDARTWKGFLRNLIIRNSVTGDLMVILVFSTEEKDKIRKMMEHLIGKFPEITSLYYVINGKKNDVITDLPFHLHYGSPYITERMTCFAGDREIDFHIGPASFFQTNSKQAFSLYREAARLAGFTGQETVYDLYCGTGTIACFIAGSVEKVVGIESVPSAIEDATENAHRNNIQNAFFFEGMAEKILTPEFIGQQGKPDVIITDPPRMGMHEKVVRSILHASPAEIVYVSCNPATQARDIGLLKESYDLAECQPVDMFPHTQHVENIALLHRRS